MNFLLTVCAGLLTYYHQVHECHGFKTEPFDLDSFMKNFEKSQNELKWIRDQSRETEENGNSRTENENSFDEDDENNVDHWYNKYRRSECSGKIVNGYCGVTDNHSQDKPKENQEDLSNANYLSPLKNDLPTVVFEPDQFLSNVGIERDDFEIDNDKQLSLNDRMNIEEYNDQMVPNPNTYKINNELNANDVQIREAHDTLRSELGFSPLLTEFPLSGANYKVNNEFNANDEQIREPHDTLRNDFGFLPLLTELPLSGAELYNQVDNDYGNGNENENDFEHVAIQKKRYVQDSGNNFLQPTNIPNEVIFNDLNHQTGITKNDLSHDNYLNDQTDTGKNDLSHEANYKLSKGEQESENKQQFNNQLKNNKFTNVIQNTPYPVKSPYKKQSPASRTHQYGNKKLNPNNEINLKISTRMMSKGLGASLPSQSQELVARPSRNRLNIDIENQQLSNNWNDDQNDYKNDLSDYVGPSRRLLQYDYDDSIDEYQVNEKRNVHHTNNLFKIGLIKTKDDKVILEETTTVSNESRDQVKSEKIGESRANNSSDRNNFQSLSESLKSIQKCVENWKESKNKMNENQNSVQHDDRTSLKNSTSPEQDDEAINKTKFREKLDHHELSLNKSLVGQVNKVKIQLEFDVQNITVKEDNSKIKLAKEAATIDHSHFVKRNAEYAKELGIKESKIQKISSNSSIVDLVSGRLPNQLIQAVFELVHGNPRLNEIIGSKLDMNNIKNLGENNINLFKSKQKTERIVKKLMSSITGLIEDQITHQTCITLPSDLQSFYDKVIYIRTINLRENNAQKQNNNKIVSTKRFIRSIVPDSDLHQKYKTIEKLLKQYGRLKLRDQMKIYDVKVVLQNHLDLLDDLKSSNSEFVRRSRSVDTNEKREKKVLDLDRNVRRISREYVNLLKTTKLIKTTSLVNMEKIDVISS